MKARWGIVALLALAAIIVATTIVVQQRKPAPEAKAIPPQVAPDPDISLPAILQAAVTVPVAVPVEGKIESFQVGVGDEVYEGQLLAQVRSMGLETARQEAEIDLEDAQTRVHTLEAAVSSARLESSRATADATRVRNEFERARRTYQREKMLLAEGATPRRVFERAEKELQALESDAKNVDAVATAAEDRISATQRELDAARKLLENKAEDLEATNRRIGSGDVLAPVNGIIVARRGQTGDDVHPSITDLFLIASDLSVMHAVAELPPTHAGQIKQDQPATVTIVEMGGEMLQGTVRKIENEKVTVEFANPNAEIKPGLTAQIRIKLR